jgi:hypothetical protein
LLGKPPCTILGERRTCRGASRSWPLLIQLIASLSTLYLYRGCHTYVVREGWEGLVRGNAPQHSKAPTPIGQDLVDPAEVPLPTSDNDGKLHQPLSYGAGLALRYQALDSPEDEDAANEEDGEHRHGGDYIIRVGWDDVGGWLGEVSLSPSQPSTSSAEEGS